MENEIAERVITHARIRKQPKPFPSLLVFFTQIYYKLGLAGLTEATQKRKKLSAHLIAPHSTYASHPSKTQEIATSPPKAENNEQRHLYQKVSRIYQTINNINPGKFTLSFVDILCNETDSIIDSLVSQLAHTDTKKFISAIDNLIIARNELVLIIDSYGFEEIDPTYRLVLRNKALSRLRNALYNILLNWPAPSLHANTHYARIMSNLAGDASTDAPPPPKKKKPKGK